MKLRNKKTGQVGDFVINRGHFECFNLEYVPRYSSLAELTAEWEDVQEEPKEYWYIDEEGSISNFEYTDSDCDKRMQTIGNFFESKEEAEKAVEKLKAWQRLKDAGLKIDGWDGYVHTSDGMGSGDHFDCCGFVNIHGKIQGTQEDYSDYRKDLDLLFPGGEE